MKYEVINEPEAEMKKVRPPRGRRWFGRRFGPKREGVWADTWYLIDSVRYLRIERTPYAERSHDDGRGTVVWYRVTR